MSWICTICEFLNESVIDYCADCGNEKNEEPAHGSDGESIQKSYIEWQTKKMGQCSTSMSSSDSSEMQANGLLDQLSESSVDSKSPTVSEQGLRLEAILGLPTSRAQGYSTAQGSAESPDSTAVSANTFPRSPFQSPNFIEIPRVNQGSATPGPSTPERASTVGSSEAAAIPGLSTSRVQWYSTAQRSAKVPDSIAVSSANMFARSPFQSPNFIEIPRVNQGSATPGPSTPERASTVGSSEAAPIPGLSTSRVQWYSKAQRSAKVPDSTAVSSANMFARSPFQSPNFIEIPKVNQGSAPPGPSIPERASTVGSSEAAAIPGLSTSRVQWYSKAQRSAKVPDSIAVSSANMFARSPFESPNFIEIPRVNQGSATPGPSTPERASTVGSSEAAAIPGLSTSRVQWYSKAQRSAKVPDSIAVSSANMFARSPFESPNFIEIPRVNQGSATPGPSTPERASTVGSSEAAAIPGLSTSRVQWYSTAQRSAKVPDSIAVSSANMFARSPFESPNFIEIPKVNQGSAPPGPSTPERASTIWSSEAAAIPGPSTSDPRFELPAVTESVSSVGGLAVTRTASTPMYLTELVPSTVGSGLSIAAPTYPTRFEWPTVTESASSNGEVSMPRSSTASTPTYLTEIEPSTVWSRMSGSGPSKAAPTHPTPRFEWPRGTESVRSIGEVSMPGSSTYLPALDPSTVRSSAATAMPEQSTAAPTYSSRFEWPTVSESISSIGRLPMSVPSTTFAQRYQTGQEPSSISVGPHDRLSQGPGFDSKAALRHMFPALSSALHSKAFPGPSRSNEPSAKPSIPDSQRHYEATEQGSSITQYARNSLSVLLQQQRELILTRERDTERYREFNNATALERMKANLLKRKRPTPDMAPGPSQRTKQETDDWLYRRNGVSLQQEIKTEVLLRKLQQSVVMGDEDHAAAFAVELAKRKTFFHIHSAGNMDPMQIVDLTVGKVQQARVVQPVPKQRQVSRLYDWMVNRNAAQGLETIRQYLTRDNFEQGAGTSAKTYPIRTKEIIWTCQTCGGRYLKLNEHGNNQCSRCEQNTLSPMKPLPAIEEELNDEELSTPKFLIPTGGDEDTYQQLLGLDGCGYVANAETFECTICFMECKRGEGVVLRECLHTFCRECLTNVIEYCDNPEVKCPYIDAKYSCDGVLQEREIRGLVTKEIYQKHLAKSIRLAENQMENAFHCKTPNCSGWCTYDNKVNIFQCPVCGSKNCLNCQAIHNGLNCWQYQEHLSYEENPEVRETLKYLQRMVQEGNAMHCPKCMMIVMKKDGCDALMCTMCKTEICWVTRGPRWGPRGKGDTSGGCKCKVFFGQSCHPNCRGCH